MDLIKKQYKVNGRHIKGTVNLDGTLKLDNNILSTYQDYKIKDLQELQKELEQVVNHMLKVYSQNQ